MALEDVSLLIQKDLLEVLKGSKNMDVALKEKENAMMIEKAHSAIILSLGDKLLRQVSKEKTVVDVWSELKGLYMTKSLVNIYLK